MVASRSETNCGRLRPIEFPATQEDVRFVTSRVFQLMTDSMPALQQQTIGLLPIETRTIGQIRWMFCLDRGLYLGVPSTLFPRKYSIVNCSIRTDTREDKESVSFSFRPSLNPTFKGITNRIQTIQIDQWLELGRKQSIIRVFTDGAGVFTAGVRIDERKGKRGWAEVILAVTNNPFGDGRTYPRGSITGLFDGETGKLLY